MVVVETTRTLFRLVEVYYAQEVGEIDTIRRAIAPNRILYLRQALTFFEFVRWPVWYRTTATILLDLRRDIDQLFSETSSTCRRQIRRIDRIANPTRVRRNDSTAYRDFLTLYNDFVAHNRHSEQLSKSRLDALRPSTDLFVAYFDGRPLCGHVFIRDERLRRVGLLLSASTRLRGEDAPVFVGSMNRWLHWHEIQLYKSEGMLVYDLGGAGTDTPRQAGIARFKRSFGGREVLEHNYIAANPLARMAIALFYALRRARSPESTPRFGAASMFTRSCWTKIGPGSQVTY
jgi:hypothetical protein